MQRPIGYWLKAVDQGLESAFAEHGVTRREWQILNGLSPAAADDAVRAGLVGRGWLHADGTVSPAGAAAREEIAVAAGEVRRRSTIGVTEEDYLVTVRTLATMAANLGHVEG